jgi:predicted signal transduction protein with EAL and GGDEF domain
MLENLGPQAQDAATQSRIVGEKILGVLNRPYDLAGSAYHNTPSVGITLFGGQQVGIDELMKRADLAMYEAKATGRNTLRFFDPQMQAVVTARRRSRKTCVKRSEGRVLLYYQPQVDRWPSSRRGRGAAALAASRARSGFARPSSFRSPRKPA